MITQEVESAGSNSSFAESECVLETEDSVSVSVSGHQENRRRFESMKKLKKVRSIRLHRISSMRSSTRRGKPQNENLSILSSIGTERSEGITPIEISDASPHYMMGTSSSQAKESFQNNTQRILTRVSTLKLKRSFTRKLSGRSDQKRKLKSSRSIKIGTFKSTKSTRKVSESIHGSDDHDRESTNDVGNKTQRATITRRLSFKPVRILTKIPTFRSKNSSMEKCHHEPSLHRATCSSTLKDSHFTDRIELPGEGSGSSQVVSTMKICPYTYCSLHGHRRDDVPPLKRFVSMRRRQLKAQRSKKMDGGPVARSKQPGNAKKATQKTRNSNSENCASHPHNVKKPGKDYGKGSTLTEGGTSVEDKEEKCNLRYDMIDFEESTSVEVVDSSASDIGILEGEVATEGKILEGDYEVMQMTSVPKEAAPACTTDVPNRMQERNDRYMTMWHLVYKHAVLANTGSEENKLPLDGNDKEGGGKEAHSFDGVNSSSSPDRCETDGNVEDENKSLIDLVQKAFDEILLLEPEDLSSRGVDSDEELSEKSEDKREEGNISASRESPQEETSKDENLISHAEDVTGQRMGSKPEMKTPKSWSNLKKILVLRRFVKAMEKARKLNFQRPRHLPLDADFEAEKVSLKHQTAEEKRNAEEWMLDYALQKVISKLAPAQRQRVSLLVEAFETILPFQEAQNGSLSSTTMETQTNPVQPLYDSLIHGKEESEKGNASDIIPMPESHNHVVLKERCLDYPETKAVESMPATEAVKEELDSKQSLASSYDGGEKASNGNDNIHLAETKDSGSRSLSYPVECTSTCHEEAPSTGTVNEVSEELKSTSQSELFGGDFETKNKIGANSEQFSLSKSLILKGLAKSLGTSLVGSGESSDLLDEDEPISDRKERNEKAKLVTRTLEGIPAHDQSKGPMSAIVEHETQPEKQNYTGLWYLVYKHMVSDSAENDSKSQSDGSDETVSEHESSRTSGTSVSDESSHVMNPGIDFKDRGVADREVQLQQIEAIKMVEEAIDSIIPDVQDHTPDMQLLADNTVSDSTEQPSRTETAPENGITQEQNEVDEEGASTEVNKPNQQLSRSWSNLKKVILLRRFIKALEKVRKFSPRGPRYLPLEPDAEAEKINLRHQDMADRKGTEEWMLDYALRQVVSKLTPERKRKVGLLVEAFETVIPTIKN